jgi:hypothetical protein
VDGTPRNFAPLIMSVKRLHSTFFGKFIELFLIQTITIPKKENEEESMPK